MRTELPPVTAPAGRRALVGVARPRPARTACWRPTPGPMTLDGTNTWVLLEPGVDRGGRRRPRPARRGAPAPGAATSSPRAAPGWPDAAHPRPPRPRRGRAALRRADRGARPAAVGRGHDGLGDGDVVRVGGLEVRVVATPGHTSDSLSFVLPADHALLTGDTVLGRGTTVVAHPDGELAAYLDSLERLAALTGGGEVDHDPARARPGGAGRRRRWWPSTSRTARERLEQVRAGARRRAAPTAGRGRGGAGLRRRAPRGVAGGAAERPAQLDYLRS